MFRSLIIIAVIFIIIVSTSSCFRQGVEKEGNVIQNFDVSPDGKYFVVSWTRNNRNCLFRTDIDGKNSKLLIDSTRNVSLYSPKFSSSGDKIVYLEGAPQSIRSSICIAAFDGSAIVHVLDTNSIKTQVVFSSDDKRLYFTQAEEYKAYSPIGIAEAHKTDIFSIVPGDLEAKKITNFSAYSLGDLVDVDSISCIIRINGENEGLFFYNKVNFSLQKVLISNDTLTHSQGYDTPILINDSTMICSNYYFLVELNLKTKLEKIILGSTGSHFKYIRYNKKLRKLFFQKTDDTDVIHSINLDGSGYTDIPILIH